MEGARIEQVILRRANLRIPFSSDFAERLEGQAIRAVNRRAKYLIVELSSGESLVMHLGMSGWFRVLDERRGRPGVAPRARPETDAFDKHDHVIFELSNGVIVVFNDDQQSDDIEMIAVDPRHQRRGVAAALMQFALDRMRASGVRLAGVVDGGDHGHEPARRAYERAGFTALPLMRSYKTL